MDKKIDRNGRLMVHYIYLIKFENGWGYIGQKQHHDPYNDKYTGSGCKEFLEAKKKFFFTKEIITIIPYNRFKIDVLEKGYTKQFRKEFNGKLYNVVDGPPFGLFGKDRPPMAQSTKDKISIGNKGKKIGTKNGMSRPEVSSQFRGAGNNNFRAKAFTEKSKLGISIGKRAWLLADPEKNNPMKNPVTSTYVWLLRMGREKSFHTKIMAYVISKLGLEDQLWSNMFSEKYFKNHRLPHFKFRNEKTELDPKSIFGQLYEIINLEV